MPFEYKTIDGLKVNGLKVDGSNQNEYVKKIDFKSRRLAR